MPVFRVEKNTNYTTMCNYHLRDRNLTLKAKGLLSVFLSLPDNWDYSIAGLAAICKEGRSGISSGLKELEQCGYLVRERRRDAKGPLRDNVYVIYEMPQQGVSPPIAIIKNVISNLTHGTIP
ncbi:MAG: helix-turn-helix domain-containing protein, partial [Clostridiales bacterium]|nr:helix-turn-helix domain-containing protein [Clostridiales bacterium]